MEQHPVPKNVLTVEFKLFGSLTVGQFMRILLGGITALVIFSLNINPLISWPLIILVVVLGIASALVKDFEVRLFGMIRSLFVSPRYVWRKRDTVPEVLIENKKVNAQEAAEKAAQKRSEKQITDISLDRLLDARAAAQSVNQDDISGGNNFDRVYKQSFTETAPLRGEGAQYKPASSNLAGPASSGQEIRLGPNTSLVVQPVRNTQPRPLSPVTMEKQEIEVEQISSLYEQEIQTLQDRLTELTKAGASPTEKQAVIERINELYGNIKQAATANAPIAETKKLDPKRMLYGVIIDKAGQPIMDVQVSVIDQEGEQVGPMGISGDDGRFAVESEFAPGDYVVNLSHPDHQFLKFKIKVQSDRLPAYRFREK
jgi:hypothetical protein